MADELKNDDFDATTFDASDDEAFDKFLADGEGEPEEEITPEANDDAASEPETADEEISQDDPEEAEEPAQKPKADGKRTDATDPFKQRVPLNDLLKEREKTRDLEARLKALEEAAKPPEPEAAPAPRIDPLTDPDGFYAQQDEERAAIVQRIEQNEQQQQQQAALQQLAARVAADVQQARAETPDYDAARDYARQSRANELRALHPTATDEQITQQVDSDELHLAQSAVTAGERPTARLMAWAAARGYAADTTAKPNTVVPIEEAKARNRTLGGNTGTKETSAAIAKMNYDEIGGLSDAEFEAQLAKMNAG